MDDTTPEPTDEHLRTAFQLLANETRLGILHALWNAPEWTATFSELKGAVGMRDSGQFQYHLNKLTGTFVRRTEDGYAHLAGGIALYRAMLGTVAGPETVDPIPLGDVCPACDEELELAYENQVFYARCSACGETVLSSPFPPAGLENRTNEGRLRAFDRWTRRLVRLLGDGVCPWCASTVTHELSTDSTDGSPRSVRITHACDCCGGFLRTTVGENVVDHPAVVSFFHERGVDITEIPHWELDFCTSDEGVELVSEDPLEVLVTIEESGDSVTISLDEEMRAREIDRSSFGARSA